MKVTCVIPILNVSDMDASFAWFEKLGWQKAWDWGEPSSFGAIRAGQCEIFLCLDAQGGRGKGPNTTTMCRPGDESADQGVWMSVFVDDIDALHRRCVEHGLDVTCGPEDMPWGVREVHVRHPDGHVFRLGQALPC